jgi:hypothetical protein
VTPKLLPDLEEVQMHVFCTYCSREKSTETDNIPAINRYQSTRIEKVYTAASQLGLGFYILSGEFGLLPPQQLIPWYDHLMKPEEVSDLANRMAVQILEYGITRIVYFTSSFLRDPNVIPYHDAIVTACSRTSRPLLIVETEME